MESTLLMKQVIYDILKANSLDFDDLKDIGAVKIKNDPYLDLNLEYLGQLDGHDKYSLTHYFEQNGDLMKDPDMEFLDMGAGFLPISYQLDSIPRYDRAVTEIKEKLYWNKEVLNSLMDFTKTWANNIKAQNFKNGDLYIDGMLKKDWDLVNTLMDKVHEQYRDYKGYTDAEEQLKQILKKYNRTYTVDENNNIKIMRV